MISGGIVFGVAKGKAELLRSGDLRDVDVGTIAIEGQQMETAGVGLMIGGGVAIAASVLWVVLAPSSAAKVAIVPTPSGGAVVIGGSF